MATIFYERDANPSALKEKTIAAYGYGSKGHAQAQNLRDSGYNVIIGLDPTRPSAKQAKADGFTVLAPAEAAKKADWLQILTPDETQAGFYESAIKPGLNKGKILGFSHGFSIHFKAIVPPADGDLVMIARQSRGHLLRRGYAEARGAPSLISEGGWDRMRYSISNPAEYGDLTRGPKVVGDETRAAMKKIIADIQAGTFAREWINENKAGGKNFAALREAEKKHPVEAVGANLRGMRSPLQKHSGKHTTKAH